MHKISSHIGLIATISEKGAELISLTNNLGKEFIWEGNPEFWGKHSPVLFPIVGTLKENQYDYQGRSYSLSRHGFARDMPFKVIEKSVNSIAFSLSQNAKTLLVYPFHFDLIITYTLEENLLNIKYTVKNKNSFEMPFSLGAHPAFALSENFEDYSLLFPNDQELNFYPLENDLIAKQTETMFLDQQKLPLNYKLFQNDALVFKTLQSKTITILKKDKPQLSVHIKDFPNLGIWTKVNAPFICIEPWFGYSDSSDSNGSFVDKEGIQILKSNNKFEKSFSIEIF